ncbi:hypothetical protein DFR70_103682 [Nocardia tenerifensis]|uniref:Uncharacterized protein n=1 Tax=Nocardia tenerifensis TaxID=228006 RepID=A0A318KTU0_9NOCA|nr:hypothetical protein [Nocardia tenerifensis]PXX66927.1 hypothetical protein DFR70_103682 [Nocardia tenerifensis]
MEPEHEDAMRTDFAELVRLRDEVLHAEVLDRPNSEVKALDDQRHNLEQRWSNGPHAQAWKHLCSAYRDWERNPERVRQFLAWTEHYRDIGHERLTAVEQRNIEQARELSGNTFHVDYERNAPDAARFTPEMPVPAFGPVRRRIERGR